MNQSAYEGCIDRFDYTPSGLQLTGWVADLANKSAMFRVDCIANNEAIGSAYNASPRNDLIAAGKSSGQGGFQLLVPYALIGDAQELELITETGQVVATTNLPKPMPIASFDCRVLPLLPRRPTMIIVLLSQKDDLTSVWLNAFLSKLPNDALLTLKLTEPSDACLAKAESLAIQPNIMVSPFDPRLSLVEQLKVLTDSAMHKDVVLVRYGIEVSHRWLVSLHNALGAGTSIGSVSPLSGRLLHFYGLAQQVMHSRSPDISALASSLRRLTIAAYPTLPLSSDSCLYIRAEAWNALPFTCLSTTEELSADTLLQWCALTLRRASWSNVLDVQGIISDQSITSGTGAIFANKQMIRLHADVPVAVERFRKSSVAFALSHTVRKAYKYCLGNGTPKPRVLYVISTLTGGTPKTNQDLMSAVSKGFETWLLHCDLSGIYLYRCEMGVLHLEQQYHYQLEPVDPLTHESVEYNNVISKWLSALDFQILHIRHIGWHSLSLIPIAKQQGLIVVFSFHDYYALCPTVKLLDELNQFCSGCCTVTNESSNTQDCLPELWPSDSFPRLKGAWVKTWRMQFNQALSHCDRFITTHASVRQLIAAHLEVDDSKFRVIAHGRDFEKLHQLSESYNSESPLKVLLLGTINTSKGAEIIKHLLAIDGDALLEFHVLGEMPVESRHPRLHVHGVYEREEIAARVADISPHIGGVFSIWNETWCHTLTELWSVGLPVLALDYPTVSDRLKKQGAGWLIDQSSLMSLETTQPLVQFIASSLEQKKQALYQKQKQGLISDSIATMSQQYTAIYNEMLCE